MSFSIKPKRSQDGFSLIELMLVVMVIGVIAAMGAPVLHDAKVSAQRSAALSSLRRIHGVQTAYRIQYGRYGTMQELNTYQNNGLGETLSAMQVRKSGYTYELTSPSAPTLANVENGFTIQANGFTSDGQPNVYILKADGTMQQIAPVVKDLVKYS